MREIDIIIELSMEYFEKKPNSSVFHLQKAVLGNRLGVKAGKTEDICKVLANDYGFIENGRGKLIIDRQSFEAWVQVQNDRETQIKKKQELLQQYSSIIEDTNQQKATAEKYEQEVAQKQQELGEIIKRQADLKDKMAELEGLQASLPAEIERLKEDIGKKEKELEPYMKERNNLAEQYLDIIERFDSRVEEASWFTRQINKNRLEKIRSLIKEAFNDFNIKFEKMG